MQGQSNANGCSPVLAPSEISSDYLGYKILNADGTLSDPTTIPQQTLRSKSINNVTQILQNGNNSNIAEHFVPGLEGLGIDFGGYDSNRESKYMKNDTFLIVSFGILIGIIWLWKRI